MTSREPREFLTVAEAGQKYEGLGERWFRRQIAEKRIRYYKVEGRVLLLDEDINAKIESGRVDPVTDEPTFVRTPRRPQHDVKLPSSSQREHEQFPTPRLRTTRESA